MTPRRLITLLAIAGAVGAPGWWTYRARVTTPATELRAEIATLRSAIQSLEKYNRTRVSIREQLDALRSRTLGATSEEVEHTLRVLLHEVGRANGLESLSVDSRLRGAPPNPVIKRNRNLFRDDALRSRTDFLEVEGTLGGTGNLQQALRVVAQLQSQPWLKRIVSVRLTPRDEGARVDLALTLRIVYFPGPSTGPTATVPAGYDADLLAIADTLAARAPFTPVQPPAAPPTQARPEKPVRPAQPPPPPYADWRITGYGEGASGDVLYLTHVRDGECRAVDLDGQILNMVFRGLDGPFIVLEVGGKRYHFEEGDTLDLREEVRAVP